MDPRDIAKLVTDIKSSNGIISEQLESADIPRGDGPFNIFFIRGTVVRADHIAASSVDPNLFYAGIDPSGYCFKKRNRRWINVAGRISPLETVPRSMVFVSDHKIAKHLNIKLPKSKNDAYMYAASYKHIITFNPKNVLRVEKVE